MNNSNVLFSEATNCIIFGDVDSFSEIIRENPSLINECYLGETLLHIAADNCQVEIASILLLNKANPNTLNSTGESPLHLATFRSCKQLVKLFLSKNADPNQRTFEKKTALHYAVASKEPEIIKLLLFYGASPEIRDLNGKKPLEISDEFAYLFPTKKLMEIIDEVSPTEEVQSTINSLNIEISSCMTDHYFTERISCKEIFFDFLNDLGLQHYYKDLVQYGFDDLRATAFQMLTPIPINDSTLQEIGIRNEKDRKNLIKSLKKISSNFNVTVVNNEIKQVFEQFKIGDYFEAFVENGYDDMDFLIENAFNQEFFNESILKDHIKVEKPGHRLRILGIFQFLNNFYMKKSNCSLL